MEFNRYMGLMRLLYIQGARSNESAGYMRRFGGSLKLAADNSEHIRIDPDSILGMQRRTEDRWTAANIGWRRHSDRIRARIRSGETPARAVYAHMRENGTHPHLPAKLQSLTQECLTHDGSIRYAWQLTAVEFRRRFAQGSAVMTDTFGALTTMAALAWTADDWTNATPDEWDTALQVGAVGQNVGQMLSAHGDALSGNTLGFERHEGLN